MSDIEEQLRSVLGLYCSPPAPYTAKDIVTLLHEAAAAIQQLRAEIEAWQVGQEAITDQLSSRNREITRLKAALRVQAEWFEKCGHPGMAEAARAALEPPPPDDERGTSKL